MPRSLIHAPPRRGFTIIELMVTVVILSVITAFAVPAMRDFIQRGQATAVTSELLTALSMARSEALRSVKRVSLCASSDGATCTNDGFANGFIVFIDQSTPRDVNAGDVIIQVFGKPAGDLVFDTEVLAVSYMPSGMRELQSEGAPSGTCFELIVSGNERSRSHVNISVSGAVRTGKGACT